MKNTKIIFGIAPLLLCCAVPCLCASETNRPALDKFAEIAAQTADYSMRDLVAICPELIVKRLLPLDAEAAATFRPLPKMSTAGELLEELRRQRELHAPFLKDLAPPLESVRSRMTLESFDWRIETDTDRSDFAGTLAGKGKWERVAIPHYGPPMGRAG